MEVVLRIFKPDGRVLDDARTADLEPGDEFEVLVSLYGCPLYVVDPVTRRATDQLQRFKQGAK